MRVRRLLWLLQNSSCQTLSQKLSQGPLVQLCAQGCMRQCACSRITRQQGLTGQLVDGRLHFAGHALGVQPLQLQICR